MRDPMIVFDRATKTFPGAARPAVRALSLEIAEGETVVLVGPSGCGKTTSMRMVNRLVEPTSGRVLVGGKDVMAQDPVELRRGIGYVIQSIGLLPHRTIGENIATVPALLGWDKARIRTRTDELLTMLGLDADLLQRYPGELSGGQRQRVGVARALAADPPVMLMDEPFGAVDPVVRGRLQDQFLEIQERLRKTIVFVTHDIDEAIKMADRIAVMNVGGVLEQFAQPEEILRSPANDFVRGFIGGERGLKRLALLPVSQIRLERGPVVEPGAADLSHVSSAAGTDWVVVVSGGRLLGWVPSTGSTDSPRPFSATVSPDSSLREALDAIVTTQTNVAAVTAGDGSYLGLVTLEALSREIVA